METEIEEKPDYKQELYNFILSIILGDTRQLVIQSEDKLVKAVYEIKRIE